MLHLLKPKDDYLSMFNLYNGLKYQIYKVSFGTFTSGTGLTDDPMIFTNGSSESCGSARSGELYFRFDTKNENWIFLVYLIS